MIEGPLVLADTERLLLEPVVTALVDHVEELQPWLLMLVGALARDVLHRSLGQGVVLRATHDIDVAIALRDWDAFESIVEHFEHMGHTGARFRVSGGITDLLPFGDVEEPPGKASPRSRRGVPMDVWGMSAAYGVAHDLRVNDDLVIRIPTPAGFGLLKLAAWMDRHPSGQYKDADDLGTLLHWYRTSGTIDDRLFELQGRDKRWLDLYYYDTTLASAALAGFDIATTASSHERHQLGDRLERDLRPALLSARLRIAAGPFHARDDSHWQTVVAALAAGLADGSQDDR